MQCACRLPRLTPGRVSLTVRWEACLTASRSGQAHKVERVSYARTKPTARRPPTGCRTRMVTSSPGCRDSRDSPARRHEATSARHHARVVQGSALVGAGGPPRASGASTPGTTDEAAVGRHALRRTGTAPITAVTAAAQAGSPLRSQTTAPVESHGLSRLAVTMWICTGCRPQNPRRYPQGLVAIHRPSGRHTDICG
jgi:hypothetical protein